MPLSNLVFQAQGAPNLAGPALQVIANRPNPYAAFSKGYDDQQKRDLALQQYREAKLKADLATALYPDLLASQQAQLRARIAGYNNPTNPYATASAGVGPIDTTRTPAGAAASAPELTPPTDEGTNTTPAVRPAYQNPFSGPAPSLFPQGTPAGPLAPTQMIPGVADATPYSGGDFGAYG